MGRVPESWFDSNILVNNDARIGQTSWLYKAEMMTKDAFYRANIEFIPAQEIGRVPDKEFDPRRLQFHNIRNHSILSEFGRMV